MVVNMNEVKIYGTIGCSCEDREDVRLLTDTIKYIIDVMRVVEYRFMCPDGEELYTRIKKSPIEGKYEIWRCDDYEDWFQGDMLIMDYHIPLIIEYVKKRNKDLYNELKGMIPAKYCR